MTNRGTFGFPRKWSDPTTRFRRVPYVFYPSSYGTCGQWVRSTELIDTFTDLRLAQIISTWADQSGSANNFSAGTALSNTINTPLFLPNAWRGFPGVYFGATKMTSAYVPATGANARSIVYVISNTIYAGNTRGTVATYGTTTANQAYGLDNTNSGANYFASYYLGTGNQGGAISATKPDVVIQAFDGTNDKLYVNGSSTITATPALNTSSANGMKLGISLNNSEFGFFVLYEFAAFSTNLTATDAANITAALQGQYECA